MILLRIKKKKKNSLLLIILLLIGYNDIIKDKKKMKNGLHIFHLSFFNRFVNICSSPIFNENSYRWALVKYNLNHDYSTEK